MRRLALTLTSALALAVTPLVVTPTAQAADLPTVESFELSTVRVDTTNGNAQLHVDVAVDDAPDGEGLVALAVSGRPAPDPGTGVPGIEGYSSLAGSPQSRLEARIELTVQAGFARTYPLRLIAYTWSGQEVDLTPQLEGRGIVSRVTSTVTAAPKAPTDLKITKTWNTTFPPNRPPALRYSASVSWTRPADGATPWRNRTTGSVGCSSAWGSASTFGTQSPDVSAILPCTATVRLVNDFGESPAVSVTG